MMKIERAYTFMVVLFACLLQQAVSAGTPGKTFAADMSCRNLTGEDAVWQSFIADTGKWHPETFYIVYPDLKMTFDLPYEDDRSGVANLLFIDKNTGSLRLLDTVIYKLYMRNGVYSNHIIRNYHRLSGIYDVILLYNNGKYIRQKDVLFGKNISTEVNEVNMEALNVQPCDSLSLHWLTLRTFNAPVGEKGELRKSYTADSKLECRGYVFFDYGTAAYNPAVQIDDKRTKGASDGYIEFEFDADQKIKISYVGNYSCEITLTANSGLFIVLEHAKDNNEFENALSAPLIKIR